MAFLKCPKCQKIYNDNNTYYCLKCNQRLVKMENEYNVSTNPQPSTPTTNSQYIPKCPTCQSPNVEKISLSSKVVGGALFGLFSSNVRKTMHCKNCGYKW